MYENYNIFRYYQQNIYIHETVLNKIKKINRLIIFSFR